MMQPISHKHFSFGPAMLDEKRDKAPGAQPEAARPPSTDTTSDTTPREPRSWTYSDKQLLLGVQKHFNEYTAGTGDSHVRFQDLKEAAGLLPSSRSFSQGASDVANALLASPRLLSDLDAKARDFGSGGWHDERFDLATVERLTPRASKGAKTRGSWNQPTTKTS